MKSLKNKTIDFSLEEGQEYLKKCIYVDSVDIVKPNSTIIGDTFQALNKIQDESIDLLICDPPYNLTKRFHGNTFSKMQDSEYYIYTEKWIKEIKPKLKKTASIYVCCDWESSLVIGVLVDKHFNLRNRITWGREKGRGAKENWKNSMEDIFYATVSDSFTFNIDDVKIRKKVIAPYREKGVARDWQEDENGKFRYTCPSNFWDDISIPYWSMAENTAHPTQKPEKLIAKLILASSNENDVILDPFAGSGTTGVVAKKLNRNYIDIEQNPLYCAWAECRLERADNDKTIQGYKEGIFLERNALLK